MAYGAMHSASQPASAETVTLTFKGGALPMFGRMLLSVLLTSLILPAAWGVVPLIRWIIEHVEWSDGTQARFDGEPGEVWYLFSLTALIGLLPALAPLAFGNTFMVRLITAIVISVLAAFIAVPLWQWYTRHTRIGQTADLTFDADPLRYAGMNILVQLSMYTIIGWAWAITALQRWIFSHVRSNEIRFEFTGSGLSLLWRGLAAGFAMLLIIPIPWVMRWLIVWFIEQTVMHRTAATPSPFELPR
jgi:uncharacterized membrane protein YjgN (DUF898 family)